METYSWFLKTVWATHSILIIQFEAKQDAQNILEIEVNKKKEKSTAMQRFIIV